MLTLKFYNSSLLIIISHNHDNNNRTEQEAYNKIIYRKVVKEKDESSQIINKFT